MSSLISLWKAEPVLVLGVVQAALVLAVSFGVNFTPEQKAAILALTTAGATLIARSRVSPAQ